MVKQNYMLGPIDYDKREIIELRDGGQIYLEYLFHGAVDELADDKSKRPILFNVPGLIGDG